MALISQILSTCNYYPGLIHYYAYHLIDNMANAQQVGREEPPYYLDETQIRNLLQDPKFNKQIIDKLFITLGVTPRRAATTRSWPTLWLTAAWRTWKAPPSASRRRS